MALPVAHKMARKEIPMNCPYCKQPGFRNSEDLQEHLDQCEEAQAVILGEDGEIRDLYDEENDHD